MEDISIRVAREQDLPFLWDMLYESAFVENAVRDAWRREPSPPDFLTKYLSGWGRVGDVAYIAERGEQLLGAAWFRLFQKEDRGDGILAEDNIPELAIAVSPLYRDQGIGTLLMNALIEKAREGGFSSLLLSVDPRNTSAIHLYEKCGFVQEDNNDPARGTSLMMRRNLKSV